MDQNQWRDRKVTLGGGYELPEWFASGYASAGITGRRLVSSSETTTTATTTGADDTGQYTQDIFTTVTTREYDRAWNWGVGGRVGRFYDNVLVKLDGGLDYEWGDGGAHQATVSVGVDGSASRFDQVALVGQAYWTHGDAMPQTSDQRLLAMVRYEFGGPAWRPARIVNKVPVEMPPPAPTPSRQVAAAARAAGRREAHGQDHRDGRRRRVLRIRPRDDQAGGPGRARRGHRADQGAGLRGQHPHQRPHARHRHRRVQPEAVATSRGRGQGLLVAAGLPAERIIAEGMGEANPRFPNTAAERPKNRRVDIEFVTFETKTVDVAVPAPPVPPAPVAVPAAPAKPVVEWREEEIATEPTWLRRALHNPADHKRQVDVYRTREVTTATTEGARVYTNHPPVAVNDAYTVLRNSTTAFDVLANDHDPDGNPLTIVARARRRTAPRRSVAAASATHRPRATSAPTRSRTRSTTARASRRRPP